MRYPKRQITIRIKDPCLQKIRNEFRKLFWQVVEQRIMELHGLISEITATSSYWDENDPLHTSLLYEDSLYHKEQEKLWVAQRDSITWCSVCDRFDKDMVYRPAHNMWICTGCSAEIPDIIPD